MFDVPISVVPSSSVTFQRPAGVASALNFSVSACGAPAASTTLRLLVMSSVRELSRLPAKVSFPVDFGALTRWAVMLISVSFARKCRPRWTACLNAIPPRC